MKILIAPKSLLGAGLLILVLAGCSKAVESTSPTIEKPAFGANLPVNDPTSEPAVTQEVETEQVANSTETAPKDPPTLQITDLPSEWQFLAKVFTKYVNVFGVHIFATENTLNAKVLHAAHVLAQYLDNNADGAPDNLAVVSTMATATASVIMAPSSDDMEDAFE